MKYAIGNRINFVQLESQFSNEMDMFLADYAGNNDSKYHKALSIIMQIYMRAGNTGGYFIPADKDDIIIQARNFHIGKAELEAIYDVATKRDVFDRQQYLKNHIITNVTLQIAFISAKAKNSNWSMDGEHILDFVYKKYKSDDKNKKIGDKLDKFKGTNQCIEQNGIELNRTDSLADDDLTLDEFKLLYPKKCVGLPEDWQKPQGVSLRKISEAIKNSDKFLAVKNYMSLEKLSTEFYDKVINGYYDDSKHEVNIVKNEQKKQTQNYTNREYSKEQLNELFDDLEQVEL